MSLEAYLQWDYFSTRLEKNKEYEATSPRGVTEACFAFGWASKLQAIASIDQVQRENILSLPFRHTQPSQC